MNIVKVDAAALAAEAAWIAKGAPKRCHVPVLGTVHVSVVDGGLRLRMTDYGMWRETTVPADGAHGDGTAVLVSPQQLAQLTKGAKGDALVSVDSTGVEIVVGARTVKIASVYADLDDFPQWTVFAPATGDTAVVLTPEQLKAGLVSVGRDDTLPMLTGVRFDGDVIASTDRFRLSVVHHGSEGFTGLVPREALGLFTVGKGAATVEHGDKAVRISREQRSVIAVELDAQFPKFRQLIPSRDNVTLVATFRRVDLLGAVAGDAVQLEFQSGGTLTVSGYDYRGDGKPLTVQTIAADITESDGLPFTLRCNATYLRELLKVMTSDVIEFWGTTPTRPMLFTDGGDQFLLMPVRIPG
ncbi:beta clamp domain-containing protein [Mycolicibacterium sphagni]|uniref:hypothetical protein n=1 Tax=Mycolicibacterium sphagni TaxID=1786 RepID=UPI0021F29C75|nr:hypothetical protein [Mycolicibacterium sphagni]MCV7174831.1 hypothetical protein [Mycolicibacterium sphagni]